MMVNFIAPSIPILKRRLVLLLLVVLCLFAQVVVMYAQTDTPVPPTPTLVMLEFPINPLMTQTNNWMVTFAPIAAIGIGITLSLAILGYLGRMIKTAFT